MEPAPQPELQVRVQGLAEYPGHRPKPATLCPFPACSCRRPAPLFRRGRASIAKTLVPADLLRVIQTNQEGPPQIQQDPAGLPFSRPAPYTVLGLPFSRGSSFHWEPVRRIERMPSKHCRSGSLGRPSLRLAGRSGRCMRILSHC